MKSSIISYCNLDRKNEADGILQDRFHLFYPVYISMCRSHLVVSVFGNCGPFIFMGKVVIYFIQKILLAFKIFKIFPGNKIVQKICLEIAQRNPPAPIMSKARSGIPLLMLRREMFKFIFVILNIRGAIR